MPRPSPTQLEQGELESDFVTEAVPYCVLLPPDYDPAANPYPLLLLLHGGDGDHLFLQQMAPLFRRAWRRRLLMPLVVATPQAKRSFYMDFLDRSAFWESMILQELLPQLRNRYNVFTTSDKTLISGLSMGGQGALRIAFKNPQAFAGVAALEPAIEAAYSYAEVPFRDRFYRPQDVYKEMFGDPIDEAYWQENNPANIARTKSPELQHSGLGIYLECGDQDCLYLYHGAEFLHRCLFEHGIPHEYRLVRGADHVGLSLPRRFSDALTFLGRTLDPPPGDFPGAPIPMADFHQAIDRMKIQTGYVDEERRMIASRQGQVEVCIRGRRITRSRLPPLPRQSCERFRGTVITASRGRVPSHSPRASRHRSELWANGRDHPPRPRR